LKRKPVLGALILVLSVCALLSSLGVPAISPASPRSFAVPGCCEVQLNNYGKVFVARKHMIVVTTRGLSLIAFSDPGRPIVSLKVPW
jgi:hypothetical protein